MRPFRLRIRILLAASLLSPAAMLAAIPQPTTTTLAIGPSTHIETGTTVSLQASVNSSGVPVTLGTVLFCNASAPNCTDINLLGQAQLTGAGIATVRLRPSLGTHKVKAVFHGTHADASSSSPSQFLGVYGRSSTGTRFAISRDQLTYTAYVDTFGTAPDTGTVQFKDILTPQSSFASATLGSPLRQAIVTPYLPLGEHDSVGAVTTGDLNNDGIPDIVAFVRPEFGADYVAVLLGKGDGTFTSGQELPAPFANPLVFGYSVLKAADFNGDGNLDLLISFGDLAEIWVGAGNGTFSYKSSFPSAIVGSEEDVNQAAVVADFDNDGRLDVAFAQTPNSVPTSDNIRLYLGNGDGSFAAGSAFTFSPDNNNELALDLQSLDFNNDGVSDLAISADQVYIYLGKGDGTLAATPAITNTQAVSYPVLGVALFADFNGDGKLDLAFQPGNTVAGLTVEFGKGDGTFTEGPVTSFNNVTFGDYDGVPFEGVGVSQLVAADLNQDGIADIATVGISSNTFSQLQFNFFLIGKGNGTFAPAYSGVYFADVGPYNDFQRVPRDKVLDLMPNTAIDLNSDGIPDFIDVANRHLIFTTIETTATATNVPARPSGIHQVFASAVGNSKNIGSTSTALKVLGFPITTTTTLTVVPAKSNTYYLQGLVAPFQAIAPSGVYFNATGTESYYDNGLLIAQSADPYPFSSAPLVTLASGVHHITAVYAGDGRFTASTSAVVTITQK